MVNDKKIVIDWKWSIQLEVSWMVEKVTWWKASHAISTLLMSGSLNQFRQSES